MTEQRRPSDTLKLDRAAIEREMRRQAETLPPPIAIAIAEAQGIGGLDTCPACSGRGYCDTLIAKRVRLALPPPPPAEDTGTLPPDCLDDDGEL